MGEELFRKTALDKLASPERLDVLMEVTSPKGWLALLTMGGILVGLIVWSVLGSIPERIDGQGIILSGGGLRELRSGGDGTLTKFALKLGDQVTENQVIGEISQLGTAEEVRAAQQRLDQAQREYETSKAEDQATISGINSTIAGHEADKQRAAIELQRINEDLASKEDALKKGLVTANRVEQVRRDRLSTQASLTGLESQITSNQAQIRSVQQRIRAKSDAVEKARQDFERTSHLKSSLTQLTSTVVGKVIEIKRRVGDRVTNGDVVATVEPPSSSLEPIVYINSAGGKRIKPGMEAQVSPTTVRREEFGFMKATIQAVGEYPVSPDAVRSKTANEQLAQELMASGTKIEVNVALQLDPQTASGYAWSSSNGPPFKVDGGTRVSIAVIVARRSPISYVLPIFRNAVGG